MMGTHRDLPVSDEDVINGEGRHNVRRRLGEGGCRVYRCRVLTPVPQTDIVRSLENNSHN